MKKKNPVIEKARQAGYEAGFKAGFENGCEAGDLGGREKAVHFFANKFKGLEDVPGIGPATMKKIRAQLGDQYFEEETT